VDVVDRHDLTPEQLRDRRLGVRQFVFGHAIDSQSLDPRLRGDDG
jgi:hypothetical protein